MTRGTTTIAGSDSAASAAGDWEAVRKTADLQFEPVTMVRQDVQTPAWLKALGEFFKSIFEPVGQAIGMSWPVMQWVLIGLAALLVAFIVWRLVEPLLMNRRVPTVSEPDWSPDRGAALALLEDADRLAASGQYDEATHLLLQRSVHQIATARPEWVHPASTAREIAAIQALPARARSAFAVIAARVERSRFARRALDAGDWTAAREAYADFALNELTA